MFISNICYKRIPINSDKICVVRDRYIKYKNDLYSRYSLPEIQENEILIDYRQHELMEILFDNSLLLNHLKNSEYLVFPYWREPIDPEFASHEMHYLYRYQLQGKVIDIRNCGSLCVINAFLISHRLSAQLSQNGIAIIYIEPKEIKQYQLNKEKYHIATAVFFSKPQNENRIQIIDVIFSHSLNQLLSMAYNITNQYSNGKPDLYARGSIVTKINNWSHEFHMHPIYHFEQSPSIVLYLFNKIFNDDLKTKESIFLMIEADSLCKKNAIIIAKIIGASNGA